MTSHESPAFRFHPANLLLLAAFLGLSALSSSAMETRVALRRYTMSTGTNPRDSVVQTFREQYGWWSDSAEKVVLGIWSPLGIGLALGVIIFLLVRRNIDGNRDEWIAFVAQPIESVPSLERMRKEWALTWPPFSIVVPGLIVLVALDQFVFPSTLEAALVYMAASIVVYPKWRSIYVAAKERVRSNAASRDG